MADGDARIPRLASGWEKRGNALSPAEGFLISRIDGRTPWTLLRQIGGLPPEEVDRRLESWLADGLLEVAGETAPAAGPAAASEDGIDPSLDLDVERQREILEFEARLEQPYHKLLGVKRNADTKEIKRAYFKLSKTFHPDRYFRKRIGDFQGRLECIFKKLVEACELLSDPATRAEVERSLAQGPPEPPPVQSRPGTQRAATPTGPPAPPTRREHLDRLRRRFRIPEEVLAERRFKAAQFHEASRVAFSRGSWLEAAASARLAIAFDPWKHEYKAGFAQVQAKVHEMRANELLQKATASLDARGLQEALHLYEEVIHYRPVDAEVQHRAAAIALELGELEKAQEYAEAACEIAPEVCAHHVTLSRVLRRAGAPDRARKVLEVAEGLDPKDEDVKRERRALQRVRGPGRRRDG